MLNLQKPICKNLIAVFALLTILSFTDYSQKPIGNPSCFNRCWFYPTILGGVLNIASDNNYSLYVSLSDGKLLSINSKTGEKSWETELGGDIVSLPLIDRKNVFIATKQSDKLSNNVKKAFRTVMIHSLGKTTGLVEWQIKLTASGNVYMYDSENFIIPVFANGDVYSIAKADGRTEWIKSLVSEVSSRPLGKKSEIILGTFDKRITVLSLNSGKPIKKFEIPVTAAIIIEDTTGNNLIVGDKKGILWSLNKKKNTRNWSYRLGAEISSVKPTVKGLLISSFDNFAYLISEESGKLIWKKRLPGRIAAEPQIKDNFLIITSVDESEALVIELSSGKLVNKIILGEDENFFTGEATQSKNLFVYITHRGILGFTFSDKGCWIPEK